MLKEHNLLDTTLVANIFGITPDELLSLSYFKNIDWRRLKYEIISGQEKEDLMTAIANAIQDDPFRVVGQNENSIWEKGWEETLNAVEKSSTFSMDLLAPKYFDKHKILRFRGQYIRTESTDFIYLYDQMIRYAIFSKYLANAKRVVEIGCGTGNSQIILHQVLNTDIETIAADWSTSSQRLLTLIKQKCHINMTPVNFNMLTLEGGDQLGIDHNTTVLSVHALEQLGHGYKPLLDFLLKSSPALCVHLEPIIELYDPDNTFDQLAIRYHEKRNYLGKWLNDLRHLEDRGKVQIIEERRLGFGDRYHEAYSLVVWKPCK